MRELSVSTQTTPVELAALFNHLSPDDEVAGKPGADGAVVLYACSDDPSPARLASGRSAIAARVAIEVVLQQVDGMPGAQPLAGYVREQLAGDTAARAGRLAAPLRVLATLYCKTMGAMPANAGRFRLPPQETGAGSDDDIAEFTPEQQQALEALMARLMQLPGPSKQPERPRPAPLWRPGRHNGR